MSFAVVGDPGDEGRSAMELRIGSLYEILYRNKPALASLKELAEGGVGVCYLASWSQQGYWRLLPQEKYRHLARSVVRERRSRARSFKRRRLPEPPIEEVGIYEVKLQEQIYLARVQLDATKQEVKLERVGLRRKDGSYLRLSNLSTVLLLEQFRSLQRSAYQVSRA